MLTCPACPADRVPRLVAGHSVDEPGNLLVGGELRRDRAAAFAPIYEAVAADPPAATVVTPDKPKAGRWRVEVEGPTPALVVVAEAWFPGWEAKVDGRKAPLVEADGALPRRAGRRRQPRRHPRVPPAGGGGRWAGW